MHQLYYLRQLSFTSKCKRSWLFCSHVAIYSVQTFKLKLFSLKSVFVLLQQPNILLSSRMFLHNCRFLLQQKVQIFIKVCVSLVFIPFCLTHSFSIPVMFFSWFKLSRQILFKHKFVFRPLALQNESPVKPFEIHRVSLL